MNDLTKQKKEFDERLKRLKDAFKGKVNTKTDIPEVEWLKKVFGMDKENN